VSEAAESVGKLWYDALQISAEKRYTQGLVLVLAYTWSKNLEQVAFLKDAAPTKVYTFNDRPHRVVLSAVYELPFGRGRAFAKDVSRPVNLVISGVGSLRNPTVRGGPITDLTRSDFGLVPLGQTNIPRQVQLGFKLNF
jgi:hypothetical protein